MAEEKKKRKFSLVRAFTKAVLGVVAFAALAYGGWFGANYAGQGRVLTAGERQQVTEVFGDKLNPDRVRVHARAEDDITHIFRDATGMVIPPTGHIDFYGDRWHSQDYSRDNHERYGLFMHEVTHCYQGQHFNFPLNNLHIYKYTLTPQSRFSDFGFEQQAEMVSNYSTTWLHPANPNKPHTAADSLLARVVEDQFPQARVSRDSLENARAAQLQRQKPDTNGVPVSLSGLTGPRNA